MHWVKGTMNNSTEVQYLQEYIPFEDFSFTVSGRTFDSRRLICVRARSRTGWNYCYTIFGKRSEKEFIDNILNESTGFEFGLTSVLCNRCHRTVIVDSKGYHCKYTVSSSKYGARADNTI